MTRPTRSRVETLRLGKRTIAMNVMQNPIPIMFMSSQCPVRIHMMIRVDEEIKEKSSAIEYEPRPHMFMRILIIEWLVGEIFKIILGKSFLLVYIGV